MVGPGQGAGSVHGGRAGTAAGGATSGSGGSGGLIEGGRAQGGFAQGGFAQGGFAQGVGEGGHAQGGAGPVVDGGAGAGAAGAASCEFEGKSYQVGERFSDGCKTCDCIGDSLVSCSDRLCRLACLRIAVEFAKTGAAGKLCDPAEPLACQTATRPRSLACGCPVPVDSAADGEKATLLRERWLELECGTNDPNCVCDIWERAFCSEDGLCIY
jgi:hypothetical protein